MSTYYIEQDMDRCIGCRACEVHCKTEHDVPVGPKLCEIVEAGPQMVNGFPRVKFVFMPCFHCEIPWCVNACPTGAMQRRAEDGVVFVDRSLCIGCKACMTACPWGVPQWDARVGNIMKCDYCMERIDDGKEPACVAGCTTAALKWVKPNDTAKRKREKFAKEISKKFSF